MGSHGTRWEVADVITANRMNQKSIFVGSGDEIAALSPSTSAIEAQYELNGNFNDSANSNNGTGYNSPADVATPYGGGKDFNGTTQYADIPDSASLDLAGGATVAVFFKCDTKPSGGNHVPLFAKGGGVYDLLILSGGDIRFRILQGGSGKVATIPNGDWSTGTWYWVIGTALPSGNVKLYLNTTVYVGDATTASNIDTNANKAWIAHDDVHGVAPGYFDGQIAYIRVLEQEWSQTDVDRQVALRPGMHAFCLSTGSSFTQGIEYRLSTEGTTWHQIIDNVSTQTITGAKTMNSLTLGGQMNANSQTIAGITQLTGRASGEFSITTGNNTGDMALYTRNSGGSDTQRIRLNDNAAQGAAGITVYEPIDFGHVDAGLVDPVILLKSSMIYIVGSASDVEADITGSASVANGNPGVLITTGGTTGDEAVASLRENRIVMRRDRKFAIAYRLTDVILTNLEFEFGAHSNPDLAVVSVAADDDYAIITYDASADTSYHCRTSNNSTETDTDTGVAPAEGDRLLIVSNETDIKFYINGTLVATHTTNLPTASTSLGWRAFLNTENGASGGRINVASVIGTDTA